jgi:hypothetical protein
MKYTYLRSEVAVVNYITESMGTAATHFLVAGAGIICLPIRAKDSRIRAAFESLLYSIGIPLLVRFLRKRVRVFTVTEKQYRVTVNICLESDAMAVGTLEQALTSVGRTVHKAHIDTRRLEEVAKFLAGCGH